MPRQVALCRRSPGTGHDELWQAFQIGLGQVHEPGAFIGQQVLREFGAQNRQPGFDGRHPLGPIPVKLCPCPDEHAPVQHQHALLFIRQGQRITCLPQRFDPAEQGAVVGDLG